MRAFGYLSRCEPNADEATPTLAEQNAEFLEFCHEHGYEPAATFLDAAGGDRRIGMSQLLAHLSAESEAGPGFTVVVVPAFRRLGGDANQSARSVMQLRARGAQVVSLEEGALDETRTLELWERQQPRERSARVREGMRRRAVYGHAMGRPPYGYHIGDDRRLEPVPAEADVVRYIVRMYVDEGLGIRRIAQRLNAEGYRTRRDGAWSMVTIRDLLHNRVYTGTYQRFGVSVPDNHEALISQADFQSVQAQMVARRTAPGSSARSQFLLAGLLWCGESGSRMIGVTRRQSWQLRDGETGSGVYRYYQSEARTNQSVGEYHTRRADDLEDEVLSHLRGEGGQDATPALVLAGDPNAVVAETTSALSRARSRLRALDRRLGHALDAVSVRGAPMRGLRDESALIIEEYERAEVDVERLRGRLTAQSTDADRRRRRAQMLTRLSDGWDELSFEARRALLADLIERVVVHDDRIQTILRP